MSQINTEIEKELFDLSYANKHWIYYNKNDDLCVLTNEKCEFMIKNKLIKNYAYFIKLVNKHITNKVHDIKDEVEYIKKSQYLYNKSNEIIEYISKEICRNYGLTTFEAVWLIKNNDRNYLKITIDMYKFVIKLTYYEDTLSNDIIDSKEIIISSKKLKTFLNFNKSKILQVIKNNNKINKVKMEKNKRINFEKLLQERKQKLINITHNKHHDATRKVGSKSKYNDIYIERSLKERYETQACKPFPTKYPWDSLN